ncbi:hypothetical protein XBKQ1_2740028 [Xenorhabdus bovienii str. kraussei Quebec]|uniref:Uncharacterized protein n=1 Tax=Xenorhabdus bovienii str. kraussei Quebec TaxID=1398203 RepID=A0A077P8B8_XENBV|nr:hypothetical protein XBKQ1_2740028 [Xenorhabdus bovienii str. kraussei Quebec]
MITSLSLIPNFLTKPNKTVIQPLIVKSPRTDLGFRVTLY